ncbi:MAG: glycerol-3-phosphate dehydrogenase [Actinomycetota bacterium]|jgi:glycerol-3-phosphate dehydrogenase|nr:glycerol-3-phosphate dehydrogenase [Actinomycetota bacterium]
MNDSGLGARGIRGMGLGGKGLGERSDAMERLAATSAPGAEPLDLLVVGGGITGAGIALDAASRGARVGLVERFDFASGTSSKSSKLVHGGLRYLEQREFGLMREAATERDLLRRLAPHLVEPIPFVLPVSHRSARAKFGVGLWAYDALASFRNMKVHKHVDGPEAEALVPVLPKGKVRGGYVFYDCKTDDVRLVMENLVQATRYGATSVNHCAVRDLQGSASGCSATVEDTTTGNLFEVRAKRVMVAAGVWADAVEQLANPESHPRLRPSKGIHLVFGRDALPMLSSAAFIPDAERKRMLFVIPWLESILVGTTDHAYTGSLDHPTVDEADRTYVLDSLNAIFGLGLTDDDVTGAYAGLRPLIAGKRDQTADLSRKHSVYEIVPSISGITGGKMTTYRRMARDAVDHIAESLGLTSRCRTKWIKLGSGNAEALRPAVERMARRLELSPESTAHLVRCYGDRALDVLELAAEQELAQLMVPGHPPIAAEAIYNARAEMTVHLNDLLARRTRLALTDAGAGIEPGSVAAETMGTELGWSSVETKRQVAAHRSEVERERGLSLGEKSRPSGKAESRTG